LVLGAGRRSVGLLGLSFKSRSDDLRESPRVALARALMDRGLEIKILDEDVHLEKLTGANRHFIFHQIPELEHIMVTAPEELFDHSEVIIVGKKASVSLKYLKNHTGDDLFIIDLVDIGDRDVSERPRYLGICW
jgi:GDP-mannose 6-dehydrogenase